MSQLTQWRVASGEWRTHAEQSAAAHKLLAELLGHDVEIEHDAQGVPYLPQDSSLCISISHCHNAVAVAVSGVGNVGIDVECRRKVSPSLIERVCTAAELEWLRSADDSDMAFLQLWTRKEAVLKCRRTGIKGFESLLTAANASDCTIQDLATGIHDIVAALAYTTRSL